MTSDECKAVVSMILDSIFAGYIGGKWRDLYDELGPEAFGAWMHGYFMGVTHWGGIVTLPDNEVLAEVQSFSLN